MLQQALGENNQIAEVCENSLYVHFQLVVFCTISERFKNIYEKMKTFKKKGGMVEQGIVIQDRQFEIFGICIFGMVERDPTLHSNIVLCRYESALKCFDNTSKRTWAQSNHKYSAITANRKRKAAFLSCMGQDLQVS